MTHRGRYLLARVTDVSGFWCISSGSVLLEDISGKAIEVAVYNTNKPKFPKNFCLGKELCIIEPFYKIRADGTAGIRVDKPETEIFDCPWPQTTAAWKDLGNKFIKVCADGALLCYDRALFCDTPVDDSDSAMGGTRKNKKQRKRAAQKEEAASGGPSQQKVGRKAEMCRLLTNLSLVEFKLKNYESSFYFSALALGLGHNRSKALFWLLKSLKALKYEEEAISFAAWCCNGSSQFGGLSKEEKAPLIKEFGPFGPDKQNSDIASWVDKRALEWMQKAQSKLGERALHNGGGWLKYKERGNELFVEGEHTGAKEHYVAAIRESPYFSDMLHESSFVLSNKAAAWLGKVEGTEQISGKEIAETLVGGSGFVNNSSSKSLLPLGDILTEGCIVSCLSVLLNRGGNGPGWSHWAKFLERQGCNLYYNI